MKQDEACVVLCKKVHKSKDLKLFRNMIDEEYRVHWLLDNLPVAVRNEELGYLLFTFFFFFFSSLLI
jgi:hypothetical protein